MMYKISQKTSVQPRAFAGLNSGSSLLSSDEPQHVMFTKTIYTEKSKHKFYSDSK